MLHRKGIWEVNDISNITSCQQFRIDNQGEAQDIEGAIGDSYMIQPENEGDKILVKFMANGLYSGEKTSAETEAVQAAE